ncbi:hypothetical protein [Chloroflexus sp.]|uniref:hypothetical protein n=1 Tax=Chloroflexus sp. TaxID=1904827 RepID=UPI002ACDCCA9|nr:hypothetical protein [Chloroflexus sp.]
MNLDAELHALRREIEQLRAEVNALRRCFEQCCADRQPGQLPADRLAAFTELVKTQLKTTLSNERQHGRRYHTLAELAEAIGLSNATLSRKLHGKEPLLPADVKRIVRQLLIWECLNSRMLARHILDEMGVADFTPAEYQEIELIRGYEIYPYSQSKIDRLRDDLSTQQIADLVARVGYGAGQHTPDTLITFMRERKEYAQLRMIALEVYMRAVSPAEWRAEVWSELLRDFDASVRKFTLRMVREYQAPVTEADLLHVLNDSHQDVVLYAVKLAGDLVRAQRIAPACLAIPNVANHRYWLIRLLAIEALIESDPKYNRPDTITLLQAFDGSKYWKSRKLIIEYISERYRRGCLTGADYDSALGLLEQWATDGRSSAENGEWVRAAVALLRGYDDSPNSLRQTS